MKICHIPNCSKKARTGGSKCSFHNMREWRTKNPLKDAYNNLKNSARRRHKGFSITLKQFREFCEATGYLENKGTSSYSATIDRIKNSRGYHKDNIRVLPQCINASKGDRDTDF